MEWQSIFLKSKSSSEMIKNIYLFRKNVNKSYSLGYICLKSGIKSKGYLGDVMKGKRVLTPKYNKGLLEVFKLCSKEKRICELLLKIDQASDPYTIPRLSKKLSALRKIYQTDVRTLSSNSLAYFDLIIFASFGLTKKKELSPRDIKELSPESSLEAIRKSLQNLSRMGLIENIGNHYSLIKNDVIYRDLDSYSMPNQVLAIQSAMDYISSKINDKIKDQNKSYFESSVLSIKKSHIEQIMKQFRTLSEEILAESEVGEGDSLLHFNIQLFCTHFS